MAMAPAVLVVDRDQGIHRYLKRRLSAIGYAIFSATTAEAIVRIGEAKPNVILLEINPDQLGISMLSKIRAASRAPVLALVGEDDPAELVSALDAGADDCLAKPFAIDELAIRIRHLLIRDMAQRGRSPVLHSDSLRFDLVLGRVYKSGRSLPLSRRQFKLLCALIERDGRVLEHGELVKSIGERGATGIWRLRRAIQGLRRKIEPDPNHPKHILTVTRVGYRFLLRDRNSDRTA